MQYSPTVLATDKLRLYGEMVRPSEWYGEGTMLTSWYSLVHLSSSVD